MTSLHCARCGAHAFDVSDTRFGAVPAGVLCPRCSRPAWASAAPRST